MTGTQLKKWREDFGLTQKRLSHLLAVDKSTISAWEIGLGSKAGNILPADFLITLNQ